MRRPIEEGEERVHIEASPAAAVLDLAHALYNQMLRLLAQSWGRAQPTLDAKRTLIDAAMQLMRIFAATSEHLTMLPAGPETPGVNAGVSFAMFRATDALLENEMEWGVIGGRFDELARGMGRVGAGIAIMQPGLEQLQRLAREFSARVGSERTAIG